jgi:hypothetical protein
MRRREDNRSFATRIVHAVVKGVMIASLGLGVGSLVGDIGIPVRVLGVVAALAAAGSAVAIDSYVTEREKRRCEEERRAIELEDRKVDEFEAEMAATLLLPDLGRNRPSERESTFVRLVDEQRRQALSGDRRRDRRG